MVKLLVFFITRPNLHHRITGLNDGLIPKEVIGRKKIGGIMYFLMWWENSHELTYVKTSDVCEQCPLLAIVYYERQFRIQELR